MAIQSNMIAYCRSEETDRTLRRIPDWYVFFLVFSIPYCLLFFIDLSGLITGVFRLNIYYMLPEVIFPFATLFALAFTWTKRRKRIMLQMRSDALATRIERPFFAKVCVVGATSKLEDRVDLHADFFEPVIFDVSILYRSFSEPQKAMNYHLSLPVFLFFLPIGQAYIWFGNPFGGYIGLILRLSIITVLLVQIFVIVYSFIEKRYIRISPGQLELISYRLFRSGTTAYRAINLRESNILIDTINGWVKLKPDDQDDFYIPLLALGSKAQKFSQTIIRASISAQSPRDLSVNNLSGAV